MSILATIKQDAVDVKNFLLKVAGEAPAVASTVITDVAKVAPVVEAFVPGASAVDTTITNILVAVENAVSATGTAAASNGLSVTLDQALVNDVKVLLSAAKKL